MMVSGTDESLAAIRPEIRFWRAPMRRWRCRH